MDIIIEILNGILPEIIAGIVGFGIARYTNNSNVPLDKLEITYNRLYYPLQRLMKNNDNVFQIIEKSEVYLKKYGKYADKSTKLSFNNLKKHPDNQDIYLCFHSNINDMNIRLRRRLGYLELNSISTYKYLTPASRLLIRLLIEFGVGYIALILYVEIANETVKNISLGILFVCLLIFITEIIVYVANFITGKVIEIYKNIKNKSKNK